MKRLIGLLLLLLALLPSSCALAQGEAEAVGQGTEALLGGLDVTGWQQQTPEVDINALLRRFTTGDFSLAPEEITQALKTGFLRQLDTLLPSLLRVVAVSILCGVLVQLRSAMGSDEVAQLTEWIAFLIAAVPLALDFMGLLAQGRAAIDRMCALGQSVLPTLLALLAALGGKTTVAAMQPIVLASSQVIAAFVRDGVLTLLTLCAALALLNCFTDRPRFTRLGKLLRTAANWTLGIAFTVFLGVLTVQGMTGSAIDSVALRTAKYAVDKFVPVVGGLFKDTVDTLAGASIVVKNAVGVTGLICLCAVAFSPCLAILTTLAGYKVCAAALQPLGEMRILTALDTFCEILTSLFITVLCVGAIFVVFLSVMMAAGAGL